MSDAVSQGAVENYKFQRYVAALSGIILLVKFTAWYLTGSAAILTDALESIANVGAGVIGLYALYLSMKPRDFDHPYGHGRAEFLSATIEGAMITIAGILIIMEAVRSILDPRELPNLEVGMLLILATAVANFTVGTGAVSRGKRNMSQALVASGKHLQSDSYSSFGIILGLVLMYVITKMTDYNVLWIDGAIALVFGTIIILTGVFVVKRSMDGIMDKIDIELLNKVVTTLSENRHDRWIDIHNLRIVKYGPTIHIDMHVTMPWYLNIKEQNEEICSMISLIRESYGGSAELSVTGDPCREFSCRGCVIECTERKENFISLVKWDINNLSKDEQHGEICDGKE